MQFKPSNYSDAYGWAAGFSESVLTRTGTGLSNTPNAVQRANLSLLSDFLGKLPKELNFQVTSGFRSEAVNSKVGGSSSSQHKTGLAADIHPYTWSGKKFDNADLATWLYRKRRKFPELDQVILYEDTGHVHVGICPPGATGCPRSKPRGEFRKGKKGGPYPLWQPPNSMFLALFAWTTLIGLSAGAVSWYFWRKK